MTPKHSPARINRLGHQIARPNQSTDFWFTDSHKEFYQGKQMRYNVSHRERGKKTMRALREEKINPKIKS